MHVKFHLTRCGVIKSRRVVISCGCVSVCLGASSLSASACRDAVLPQVSIKSRPPAAAQQLAASASHRLHAAGSLAQLLHRPTT